MSEVNEKKVLQVKRGTNFRPSSSLANSTKMKEITLRVPESMVRLIEEWVKHVPEMELVSLEESGEYELEEMHRREVGVAVVSVAIVDVAADGDVATFAVHASVELNL